MGLREKEQGHRIDVSDLVLIVEGTWAIGFKICVRWHDRVAFENMHR